MLKRCFIPYIVGGCIVAFLSVSYVGYRAYQNHVEFEDFMSNAQAFNRSIEGQHAHSSKDHTHSGEGLPVALNPDQIGETGRAESGYAHDGEYVDGEYVYEIAGQLYSSDTPMSQQAIEVREWTQTGKMTPAVEEAIRATKLLREDFKGQVTQRVVTPDGKLHQVIVPRHSEYEEGDAISQTELDSPIIEMAALSQKPWLNNKLIIDGVDYYPPEEYYSIADSHGRREYFNKFSWSIENSVSMAEVEKKVAQGELDFSLSESEKRRIDEIEATMERTKERVKMLSPVALPLSDKPPVKVSFLPDEGEDALPGWIRKGEYPVPENVSEGGSPLDTDTAPVRTDIPISPSDLPGMVEPTPSRPSELRIETANKTPTPLTAESIETQLKEQLSPEHFSKAKQFFDQYGSEEGLRRLRESDPEAARQFERERRPKSVPDAGQSSGRHP